MDEQDILMSESDAMHKIGDNHQFAVSDDEAAMMQKLAGTEEDPTASLTREVKFVNEHLEMVNGCLKNIVFTVGYIAGFITILGVIAIICFMRYLF